MSLSTYVKITACVTDEWIWLNGRLIWTSFLRLAPRSKSNMKWVLPSEMWIPALTSLAEQQNWRHEQFSPLPKS